MISLRGLTAHTVKSYSTYIRSYLDYLQAILFKQPEDVSWEELREYIRWQLKNRSLSDRTINTCISKLCFFTMYVLHKPWDPTQLPMRKFDSYLPFVPTQEEAELFISTLPDLKPKAMVSLLYSAGLRVGEVCNLRYCDIERKNMRIHVAHSKNCSDRYAILSRNALDILTEYWFAYNRQPGGFSQNRQILPVPLILFISTVICGPMKIPLAGNTGSPAIHSAMPLALISMKTGLTF